MYYVAKLTREGRHWLVNFPDCRGCQTFDSKHEAIEMAADALAGWLATILKHGDLPPVPKMRRSFPQLTPHRVSGYYALDRPVF